MLTISLHFISIYADDQYLYWLSDFMLTISLYADDQHFYGFSGFMLTLSLYADYQSISYQTLC